MVRFHVFLLPDTRRFERSVHCRRSEWRRKERGRERANYAGFREGRGECRGEIKKGDERGQGRKRTSGDPCIDGFDAPDIRARFPTGWGAPCVPSLQREDTGAPGRGQNEYFVAVLRTRPRRIHYGQSARRSAWNSLRWHAVSQEDSTFCVRVPTSLLDANSEDSISAPSIGNAVLGHQSETQLSQPQREGCHPAWAEGEWAARGKKGCPINVCVRTDKETRRRCAIMAAGPEHPKDTQQRGMGRPRARRPSHTMKIYSKDPR